MPAKPKISKEMIVDAAFEIARKEGMENINARTVSEKLSCSTQPVMYHFATITVAAAAPAIPQLKPNTNSASNAVLIAAPVRLHIIIIFGRPSARIKCPPPVVMIANGKPTDVMRVYVFA